MTDPSKPPAAPTSFSDVLADLGRRLRDDPKFQEAIKGMGPESIAAAERHTKTRRGKVLARHGLAEIPHPPTVTVYCRTCGAAVPYTLAPMEAHWQTHHPVATRLAKIAVWIHTRRTETPGIIAAVMVAAIARRIADGWRR